MSFCASGEVSPSDIDDSEPMLAAPATSAAGVGPTIRSLDVDRLPLRNEAPADEAVKRKVPRGSNELHQLLAAIGDGESAARAGRSELAVEPARRLEIRHLVNQTLWWPVIAAQRLITRRAGRR